MATPILEIPEVSTSILSFALLNIVLRHYEQAASNQIIDSLAAPPTSPADGDAYFVLASPTGLWSGQAGKIAFSISGAWYFMNAIPKLPYCKTSTNMLVTLDPVTATEGVFSSGSGGSAIGYYDITATSTGVANIPFNTYPAHSVATIDCSNVTVDYVGISLGLTTLVGSGGKKIEVILYNVPPNVMYTYRFGSTGVYNMPEDPVFYRSNDNFFITYDVNFTNNTITAHNASQPDFVYKRFNYTIPTVDNLLVLGQDKIGIYTYNAAFISGGGATITVTWDDNYIQSVYADLHWQITLYNIPPVVTSIVVAPPSGASSGLEGNLNKTPINGTVAFDWVFSTADDAWIVS